MDYLLKTWLHYSGLCWCWFSVKLSLTTRKKRPQIHLHSNTMIKTFTSVWSLFLFSVLFYFLPRSLNLEKFTWFLFNFPDNFCVRDILPERLKTSATWTGLSVVFWKEVHLGLYSESRWSNPKSSSSSQLGCCVECDLKQNTLNCKFLLT